MTDDRRWITNGAGTLPGNNISSTNGNGIHTGGLGLLTYDNSILTGSLCT